jgi:hypothetical protein
MYREVAGAQDEIALDILETGGSTRRFDELDASSTTLWGIARAVEKIFEETGEDKGDFVNIWLSCYEADIVSAAENFWHNKIQPSQSGL